jgi:hypothetical protein
VKRETVSPLLGQPSFDALLLEWVPAVLTHHRDLCAVAAGIEKFPKTLSLQEPLGVYLLDPGV